MVLRHLRHHLMVDLMGFHFSSTVHINYKQKFFRHRLQKCEKASFCVCDKGCRADGDWALTVKSVIVFGKIEIIDDLNTVVDITTKLSRKFTSDEDYIRNEIEQYARGTLLLRLTPEHICGKKVTES